MPPRISWKRVLRQGQGSGVRAIGYARDGRYMLAFHLPATRKGSAEVPWTAEFVDEAGRSFFLGWFRRLHEAQQAALRHAER